MRGLIRRWRGERGESYGVSLDGSEAVAVAVRPLSGDRLRIEFTEKSAPNAWLAIRKDLTFSVRHVRIPDDYNGSVYNYARAFAAEKFPLKNETTQVRSDEIQDPDGVLFVHGIAEKGFREILKDFAEAGVDPRRAGGIVPASVALHKAVEALERRVLSKFTLILHLGHTGMDFVGVRGHRVVFHRGLNRKFSAESNAREIPESSLLQQLSLTVRHVEREPHFGVPEEVILTGPWSNTPSVTEDVKTFFPKSLVRPVDATPALVSETMTSEHARSHVLAIGAAMVGLDRSLAERINFLVEPDTASVPLKKESVYDKIILSCAAAMLALAFVTANAAFLDMTKSRMEKILENQRTIESRRSELRGLEPELLSASRFLDMAAIRFDSIRPKSFSIPISVSKLLAAVESAAPDGISLDKLESGVGIAPAAGSYSNFFSNGGPAAVVLTGKADLPEKVIFFQDALREQLGVSVDIVSMGREGDVWSNKPVGFTIVLRGPLRRV